MLNIKVCCLVLLAFQITNSISDHYWKDYDGTIPQNAIQGGTDSYGYYTYIGQIAAFDYCNKTQPDIVSATIHKGNKTAYAAYLGRVYYNSKHVKILCGTNLEKYQWAPVANPKCELVQGSKSETTNYFIGRTTYDKRNITGRFSTSRGTLFIPLNTTLLEVKNFEKLQYCN